MISPKTWKVMKEKQRELDQSIYQQAQVDWEWYSLTNAKRLKLNILVEIGEFANELKTFKLWRKKKEMDLVKSKEELIDCLCFFLGLWDIYQIDFISDYELSSSLNGKLDFSDLLLKLFSQTEKLIILESEFSYIPKANIKLTKQEGEAFYHWLQIFNKIFQKLAMDEKELLNVYLRKNEINQQRVIRGY